MHADHLLRYEARILADRHHRRRIPEWRPPLAFADPATYVERIRCIPPYIEPWHVAQVPLPEGFGGIGWPALNFGPQPTFKRSVFDFARGTCFTESSYMPGRAYQRKESATRDQEGDPRLSARIRDREPEKIRRPSAPIRVSSPGSLIRGSPRRSATREPEKIRGHPRQSATRERVRLS
jgi:hypothetical protein